MPLGWAQKCWQSQPKAEDTAFRRPKPSARSAMGANGQGAMGDLSGYTKGVTNAQAGLNESKAALHRAIQTEQKTSNTLAQAQAEFDKDMSNTDAADTVVAAHQSPLEASTARENAEQAFQSSQQALTSALKNLDGAQQLDRASVNAKAQQSYDAFLHQRAEARNNERVGGQAGEPETLPPDQTKPYNVRNEGREGNPLAPGNEIDIMGEGKLGENAGGAGDAGKPDGQTAVEGSGRIITEIKYVPSSGAVLTATPGETTTILGSFGKDMESIIGELGNVKSTDFGPRNGGLNVLNVPDEIYNSMSKEQFWEEKNKRWLDEAISRDDIIVLATKPEGKYLSYTDKNTGEVKKTGFGREYDHLVLDCGYEYDAVTNRMIRR